MAALTRRSLFALPVVLPAVAAAIPAPAPSPYAIPNDPPLVK